MAASIVLWFIPCFDIIFGNLSQGKLLMGKHLKKHYFLQGRTLSGSMPDLGIYIYFFGMPDLVLLEKGDSVPNSPQVGLGRGNNQNNSPQAAAHCLFLSLMLKRIWNVVKEHLADSPPQLHITSRWGSHSLLWYHLFTHTVAIAAPDYSLPCTSLSEPQAAHMPHTSVTEDKCVC